MFCCDRDSNLGLMAGSASLWLLEQRLNPSTTEDKSRGPYNG